MSDDRRGGCRIIVADIVDGAGPRPRHRGNQHARQIRDVDAREDLARFVDPPPRPGTQRIEGAAPGAVDRGETEDVDRHAAVLPEAEPTLFGGDPAAST